MTKTIDSLERAQHFVPSMVRAMAQDPALAKRALANPLLAAEELGYEFTPEILPVLERRVRFPLETFERLEHLHRQIQELAGHPFNIDSPDELEKVLFDELHLTRPRGRLSSQLSGVDLPPDTDFDRVSARLPSWPGAPPVKDPLESLRGKHPIMEPILEYRLLDASQPALAPPAVYEQLKLGELTMPVESVTFRLQRKADTKP